MKTSTQLKQPVENHAAAIEMPTDFELSESNGTILAKFSDWTSKCRVADLTDCEHDDYKEQALVIGRKIVKAVNAHDELVRLLTLFAFKGREVAAIRNKDEKSGFSVSANDVIAARAALAKLAD